MTAICTLIGTAFLLIGLIYGAVQLAQARQLRLDQARPFVLVHFTVGDRLLNVSYLEVVNAGSVVACDVRLTFEPRVKVAAGEDAEYLNRFIDNGFMTLVPGAKRSTVFDVGPERQAARDKGEPIPNEYRVTVNYQDRPEPERRRILRDRRPRRFSETYNLDAGEFDPMLYFETKTVHDVAQELELLRKALTTALSALRKTLSTRA